MKLTKKLFALFMTAALVLAMSVTAFADDETTYALTINQTEKDHIYQVYQVFTGDLSDGVLSNVQWGDGVSPSGQTHYGSAAAKAETLQGNENLAAEFAKEIAETYLGSASGTVIYAEGTGYQLTDLSAGYYLVVETSTALAQGEAMTSYILRVVEDVAVSPKNVGVPTVVKKIVENSSELEKNEASIGDTVSFKTTATIPADALKYNYYKFVINDTMSSGLTFDDTSVVVKINNLPAVENIDYTLLTGDSVSPQTFQIALKDAKGHAGKEVEVTYSAVLNDGAAIAGDGNENMVTVVYANNPNHTYTGDEFPGENDPTGETPERTTTTYTTGLTIHKVDGYNQELKGASFRISGNGVNVVMVSSETFSSDASGAYWKLTDGTYTKTDPATLNEEAQEKYDSLTAKYSKNTTFTSQTHDSSNCVTSAVGDDGSLTFNGLGAGTYTISEVVTPAGFNSISAFTVTIGFNVSDKGVVAFTAEASDNNEVTVSDNVLSMNIVNNSGATLPSTGGIGTKVFYVLGSALLVGAAVLLISRKRMSSKA